ncbi:hypothetical protein J4406_02935 [Candidatus Woesearchaeota archaeon]|nr:hypothetical protein [Candidatus Woesearchaeota archaeon]
MENSFRNVLLLEDDIELGNGIKLSLEKTGEFRVTYNHSVIEALGSSQHDIFETFILDLHTSDGGARTFLTNCNGSVKDKEVLVTTGYDPKLKEYVELRRLGVNEVLRKPFNLSLLQSLIGQNKYDRTHLLNDDQGIRYIVDTLESRIIPEVRSLVATGSRHTTAQTMPDELTDLDLDFVTEDEIRDETKKIELKQRLKNLLDRASKESNYPLRGWLKNSYHFISGRLMSESIDINKKSPEIGDLISGAIADQTKITGVTLWGEDFLSLLTPRIESWQSWAYFISERYKLPKFNKGIGTEEILRRISKRILRWQYAVIISSGTTLWDYVKNRNIKMKSFYDMILEKSQEDKEKMLVYTDDPQNHLNALEIALILKTMSPAVYSINPSSEEHRELIRLNRKFTRDVEDHLKSVYIGSLNKMPEEHGEKINSKMIKYIELCKQYQSER